MKAAKHPIVYLGRWEQAGRRVSPQKARQLGLTELLYVPITRESAENRSFFTGAPPIPWEAMHRAPLGQFGKDFIFDVYEFQIEGQTYRVIPRVPCPRLQPNQGWSVVGVTVLPDFGLCWQVKTNVRKDYYILTKMVDGVLDIRYEEHPPPLRVKC